MSVYLLVKDYVGMIVKKTETETIVIVLTEPIKSRKNPTKDPAGYEIRKFDPKISEGFFAGDMVDINYTSELEGYDPKYPTKGVDIYNEGACTFYKIDGIEKEKIDYLYKICKEHDYLVFLRDGKIESIVNGSI